jgi:general secretion pathway protein B
VAGTPQTTAPGATVNGLAAPPPATPTPTPTPTNVPATPPPPANLSAANLSPEQSQVHSPPATIQQQPDAVDHANHEPTLAGGLKDPAASGGSDSTANPDDYAPAAEPNGKPLFPGHVKRGTESGLPLYQDAAVLPGANIPELRLDLHVYAANPQDRFALINMHKLHEGDSTPDGVKVENITPDGVIMSHNGMKFLLPRD